MQSLGLHIMQKEWAQSGLGTGRVFSTSLRSTTLKVHGTDEEMTIPVQTCTTVKDVEIIVKCMLAERLMIPVHQLTFVHKQGFQHRTHRDLEQISSKVSVKGIRSFKALPYHWPYPVGMLGAGYLGIRAGIKWVKDGCTDFVIFDRLDRIGGYCWLRAANKHSRLQTEFASFCVWFGPEFGQDKRCGGKPTCGAWDTWPDQETVLRHMQLAVDEYGLLSHCRLSVSVEALETVGRKDDHSRYYDLTLNTMDDKETSIIKVSGLLSFPGSMTARRVIEFPGEDAFDGLIGYGMNDNFPYEDLSGGYAAIVGQGAFAVENVRICLEHTVMKVYLIVRRKSLPCPRLPCWFVDQAALPVPGRLLLKQAEPMFRLAGFGDPFGYPAVHGSSSSPSVLISQKSRFAVSDVLFLAAAYGKLAFVEDTIKRLSHYTIHLTSGNEMRNIRNLIKATGLVGDAQVDRLHKLGEMQGCWPEGDCRRPIRADAPGVHGSNFEGLAQGVISYYALQQDKFFFDFPREFRLAVDRGLMDMLPVNVAEGDRPAYAYDIRYALMVGSALAAMCPKLLQLTMGIGKYKHDSMHKAHPLREHLKACREEWDKYQKEWQEAGSVRGHVPYPYTEKMVEAWYEEHKEATGSRTADDAALAALRPTDLQGYLAASQQWWMSNSREANSAWGTRKVTMASSKRAASAG